MTHLMVLLQGGSGIVLVLGSLSSLFSVLIYALAGYGATFGTFEAIALGYAVMGIFQILMASVSQLQDPDRRIVSVLISFIVIIMALAEVGWAYHLRYWKSLSIGGIIIGINLLLFLLLLTSKSPTQDK